MENAINQTQNKSFAVITGASSGIGYELAKQFARNGFDVLIAAEDSGINTAATDIAALGASVTPVEVDLANFEGVGRLYSAIQMAGRPVDAIAINAGVGVSGDFARDTALADELNFFHRAGMEDTKLGAGEKDSAEEVARDGFEALMAGDDKVIAGSFRNKLQGGIGARILPETVKAELHRRKAEPGSASESGRSSAPASERKAG